MIRRGKGRDLGDPAPVQEEPVLIDWLMQRDDADSLRRWLLLGPAILLCAVTWVAMRSEDPDALLVLGALVLFALRVAWWCTTYFESGSRLNVVFFYVCLAAVGLLVPLDSTFGYYAVVGFVDATVLYRRERVAMLAIVATAAVVAFAEVRGSDPVDWTGSIRFAVFLVGNTLVAWAIRQFLRFAQSQVIARERANAQLTAKLVQLEQLQTQIVDQARDTAQQQERARIARDLHDTTAQGLAGIITQLEAARRDRDWMHRSGLASALARSGLSEVRRIIEDLRGDEESTELSDALRRLAAGWSRHSGVAVDVVVVGTPTESPFAREMLLICQELLNNVANHSRAQRAEVMVAYGRGRLTVTVEDSGVGFDPQTLLPGHGMRGMRERAARFGGQINLESKPGRGSRATVTQPLEESDDEESGMAGRAQ